jgi:hypothetical protein
MLFLLLDSKFKIKSSTSSFRIDSRKNSPSFIEKDFVSEKRFRQLDTIERVFFV